MCWFDYAQCSRLLKVFATPVNLNSAMDMEKKPTHPPFKCIWIWWCNWMHHTKYWWFGIYSLSLSHIVGIHQTMMMCVWCYMKPMTIYLIVWLKNFASWISFQSGVHAINRLILVKSQRFAFIYCNECIWKMTIGCEQQQQQKNLVCIVNLEARFHVNFQHHLKSHRFMCWFFFFVVV